MISIPPKLQDSLQTIIKDEAYINFNLKINYFNSFRSSLSKLYEITVKGETTQGKRETNIFVKKKINLSKIQFFPIDALYSKELFVYNDLSKILTKLQDEANIPLQDRFRIAKAHEISNTDAIILENLSKKGFKIYRRTDIIPLKYVELGVEELAKFHAFSFVLKHKMPDYYHNKIESQDHILRYDDDWCRLIKKNFTDITKIYDDNPEIKRKIENFLPKLLDQFPKYHFTKSKVKCTLSHGDYRMNNVLVREVDGEPVEVVPIDYQLIDFGCPIRDLLLFIFSGSDREFRRRNLSNLKDLYFVTLSKFLKYFKIDVEAVYPREEFEEVFSEWLDYGLMVVIVMSTFLFAPDNDANIQNISLSDMPFNMDEHSIDIVRGWIDDFIEWGYL